MSFQATLPSRSADSGRDGPLTTVMLFTGAVWVSVRSPLAPPNGISTGRSRLVTRARTPICRSSAGNGASCASTTET